MGKRLILVLLVLFAVVLPIFGASWPTDPVELGIYTFESAYKHVKNEGIYFKDNRTAFRGTIWALSQVERLETPLPKLGQDEENNLKAIKEYLRQLLNKYPAPQDRQSIVTLAIEGLMSKNDSYARTIPQKEFQERISKDIGSYEGDGVEVEYQDEMVVIFLVILNTPAHRAGLMAGDQVLKVNNVSFENLKDENDFKKRLEGFSKDEFKEGQEINYEIMRDSSKRMVFKTKVIKIIDKNKWVKWHMDGQIGVIEITEFEFGCGQQFLEALNQLKNAKAKALIINVISNPGGFVNEASIIIKALTGQGNKHILSNGEERACDAVGINGPQFSGPMAVLVNIWTASAAETLTACLQEYGASVFGLPTYGKNFGQVLYLLPNKDYLIFSDHWIITPNGRSWPFGIIPDKIVADKTTTYSEAKSFLLEKIKKSPDPKSSTEFDTFVPEFARWGNWMR